MTPSHDLIRRQIECLRALSRSPSVNAAAAACKLSRSELLQLLAEGEAMYGRPLLETGASSHRLTAMGEIVLRCAATVLGEPIDEGEPGHDDAEATLHALLTRRSVSPKRLGLPGPSAEQLATMIQAALAAPDHGSLRPWRVLEFRSEQRASLADLFEAEKRRRDPMASPSDLRLAREHATRAPMLLAFIVSPRRRAAVPLREQWLTAGAALCNLLNAAHQLGHGAIVLSGERCHDAPLAQALGLRPDEALAGFISLGRIVEAPPARKATLPGTVWRCWMPGLPARGDSPHESTAPGADSTARP